MTTAYDVIVIGSGHNGLVCGTYLAKAGLRTLVLERRSIVGGAAVTEEFCPGFRASRFSYVMSLLHPRIIRDLELHSLGLQVLPANDLFCPLGGDDYILYSDDLQKTQAEFARFSRHTRRSIHNSYGTSRSRRPWCGSCCSRRRWIRSAAAGRVSGAVHPYCGGIARSAIRRTGWLIC